jgi:Na+/melibiose symporter-like transporter
MNLFQRFSFTALNLPTSAAGMPMFIFILPFYADDLGLGLSLVGIIFFFGRFTDILTDPVMGVLIDKFPSKWGKHKLWVFLSGTCLYACYLSNFFTNYRSTHELVLFLALFFCFTQPLL